MKKYWLISSVALVLAIALFLAFFLTFGNKTPGQAVVSVTNFEECKSAGYPVMETSPEQCRTPEGALFVQIIEVPTSTAPLFGKVQTMKVSNTVAFEDDLKVTLKEINDSRCKPDVECIWAGELAPLLSVTGGSYGTEVKEVRLGTTNNKTATIGDYSFTLESASVSEITVVVSKNTEGDTAKAETGFVSGHVTIGPICPVEDVDHPCIVPSETYTSREVIVFASNQTTVVKKIALDSSGNYKLSLTPGTYYIQIQPAGIRAGEKKEVIISERKTSTIDFDIDTGIR